MTAEALAPTKLRDSGYGEYYATAFRVRAEHGTAGVLYLVTSPLFLLLLVPGMIAWALISIWFLYRIVKGMVRMNANQAMPD